MCTSWDEMISQKTWWLHDFIIMFWKVDSCIRKLTSHLQTGKLVMLSWRNLACFLFPQGNLTGSYTGTIAMRSPREHPSLIPLSSVLPALVQAGDSSYGWTLSFCEVIAKLVFSGTATHLCFACLLVPEHCVGLPFSGIRQTKHQRYQMRMHLRFFQVGPLCGAAKQMKVLLRWAHPGLKDHLMKVSILPEKTVRPTLLRYLLSFCPENRLLFLF
jgi:hypothetical protein